MIRPDMPTGSQTPTGFRLDWAYFGAGDAMNKTLIPFVLVLGLARAEGGGSLVNACHDPASWGRLDILLQRYPTDTLLIRG